MEVTDSSTDLNRSSRACGSCKAGKRKCDKALPLCSRCQRLRLKCEYEADSGESDSSSINSIISSLQSWSARILKLYNQFEQDHGFCEKCANEYFLTVHAWFPIINKVDFMERLKQRSFMSETHDFLLLSSVFLIILRPDGHGVGGRTDDELYGAIRHLYFQIFADSKISSSVKLLQSGILLATYEYGHGMTDKACETLSPCISTATSLGLPMIAAESIDDFKLYQRLPCESAIVWWAIVISDRIFCLAGNDRLPMTRVINEAVILSDSVQPPRDQESSDNTNTLSTLKFYRQIHAAVLIGHVLDLIRGPAMMPTAAQSRFTELDTELRQAIDQMLKMEISHLRSVSEGFAMARTALILLHEWYLKESINWGQSSEPTQSTMTITSMTTIMIDSVRGFLPRPYPKSKSHHPQGTQPVFLAACHVVQSGATGANTEGLIELKHMLQVQSHRWAIAAKYLGLLQN